jgi:ABC-2 type transport system permease protein
MNRLFASAWVIARRDYVATVFSRIFLLFLATPIFPVLFGAMFGAIGANQDREPAHLPVVALVADAPSTRALTDAHARLVARLGDDVLPDVATLPPMHAAASRALLRRPGQHYVAVLAGSLADPHLLLSSRAPDGTAEAAALLVDTARAAVALGSAAPAPARLGATVVTVGPGEDSGAVDRVRLASGAQTGLFVLLVMLAGMSLSTFIEEKSNKVIEVLAAAVPVDAIFLGKLISMLAITLTFVAVWGAIVAIGLLAVKPAMLAHLPVPAVGWPAFCVLVVGYFIVNYLLLGAVFLGIGSQAGSPREIQVMALPVTMFQLLLYGLAAAGASRPDSWVAWAAAIFPWSSPLAMLARAAELPTLWPHLIALIWQAIWLVVALRFAAGLFRSAVLKTGDTRPWWKRGFAAQ